MSAMYGLIILVIGWRPGFNECYVWTNYILVILVIGWRPGFNECYVCRTTSFVN